MRLLGEASRLASALEGKRLLAICVQDAPAAGRSTHVLALGAPVDILVNFEGYGACEVAGVNLTREQAWELAAQLAKAAARAASHETE